MLRIRNKSLPAATWAQLAGFQAEVDAIASYADRVAAGDRLFNSRNRAGNPVFRVIRATLQAMSHGNNRCMYCEDSSAHQIDHFRPRSFYPDGIFDWNNYLWACGPCNLEKGYRFHVILPKVNTTWELRRRRGDPVSPPPRGRPAVLNPRREDPLRFMILDLRKTFFFTPRAAPGTLDHERTRLTIQLFGLNDRDVLVQGRRNAYGNYVARLEQYVRRKAGGTGSHLLGRLRNALRRLDHRTVWVEMKRQANSIPALRALFQSAPEALDW